MPDPTSLPMPDPRSHRAPHAHLAPTARSATLEVRHLTVAFGGTPVVDDVSLTVPAGRRAAIIGESGSGKSMTILAVLSLLPPGAEVRGEILLDGRNLLEESERDMNGVRGNEIGCVFQEPSMALNPVATIGRSMTMALRTHRVLSRREARAEAVRLAAAVGLPDPEHIVDRYPHELSGGQRQRVVIALALSCSPSLLLADEPTTALDATVQAAILDLLDEASAAGMTRVMVTHDMAVAARSSDLLFVMKGGRIIEEDPTSDIIAHPTHAYTRGLLAAARATSLSGGTDV